ncbi:MAG: hypothetical protein KKE37_09750 [Verrucomicrobia bacterium]|nr:hypothetical protein [Verrucomicrobiota bacterium]MBU4429619.1 hypothetical protein [Verrucomicrobiota bacterium]MCG2678943.1 hypothetical protein [Kiritimatiellia bacterium]
MIWSRFLTLAANGAEEKLSRATLRQEARAIYTSGATMRGVWMGDKDGAIRLFWGDVVQNDSAVYGGAAFEPLAQDIVLRKRLVLPDPQTKDVYLAFVAKEQRGHKATLRIAVNGRETRRPPSPIATPNARQYWLRAEEGKWCWSRWYYVAIPGDHLRTGENIIEISSVDGIPGWQIMVGDYTHFEKGAQMGEKPAPASEKSADGGKTWDSRRLGAPDGFAGEYAVRLAMRRYRENGWIMSEVLDAAGQQEATIKSPLRVSSVELTLDAELPAGTDILMSLRWGNKPYYESESWTSWKRVDASGRSIPAQGRYLQWKAEFTAKNRLVSPALRSVQLVSIHEPVPAQTRLRVIEMDNPRIVRSSYEFPFERYDHPRLRELRKACDLDKVVAGTKDDWEMIQRLMRWAYIVPLPRWQKIGSWDALAWMELARDEKGEIIVNQYKKRQRPEMCLYSNVELTQMLTAMGIPARHININSEGSSGHEVCEAWSNVHRKWILLDATRDFYWMDNTTSQPLSVLDVHNELIRRLDRIETWEDPFYYRDLGGVLEGRRIKAHDGGEWQNPLDSEWIYLTTAHFRIVPRNDYCSRPYPLPVAHGWEIWGWDGYLNWADDMVPPMMHFSQHSNRPADFYWTNNQVHLTLAQEGPKALQVHLEHDMPNFTRYEASFNDQGWSPVKSGFSLDLVPGPTKLAVRAVNTMELPGPASWIRIGFLE